jgi:hypothetical protein
MLGAILLLVRGINGSPNGAPRLLIAGMLAGLAVDTRFSMIFLAPLALVAVVAREAGWRRRIGDLFAFGAGMALTLGPLLLHYARVHGGAVPPRIASIHPPIAGELTDAFVSVFGRWAGIHPMIELPALVVGLVAITLVLHRRRGIATDTAGSRARRVPWIGAGLYFACLIAMKWIAYAEPIGARLALPGALLLLVPAGWLVAEAWRPTRAAAMALAVAVLVLRIGAEVVLLVTGATFRPADPVAASARLGWVAAETTARDLVIGDDTMDIPFWLGRPAAVSFSPWPQTSHPELATLRALCRRQSAGHDRFFIVVREHGADEVAWRQAYGPFIADLVHDRLGVDDGITRVARLADAHVFELRP